MTSGALLFSRYAYPRHALEPCGPAIARALLGHVAGGDDGELRHLAKGLEDDWRYLRLIAESAGIGDPLDVRVVEAYWIGSPLLDKVRPAVMGGSMERWYRTRAGRSWTNVMEAVIAGALPHHSFHVLGVDPWLGSVNPSGVEESWQTLDRCRIRWGQVVELTPASAMVRSRPLVWEGRSLALGEPQVEESVVGVGELVLAPGLRVGDWCALHWGWVCDRLGPRQLRALQTYTLRQLRVVNGLPSSSWASVSL